MPPRVLRQDRIGVFRVEIEQVDVVTCRGKSAERPHANGGAKTLRQRMAIDVENAHRSRSFGKLRHLGLLLPQLRIFRHVGAKPRTVLDNHPIRVRPTHDFIQRARIEYD